MSESETLCEKNYEKNNEPARKITPRPQKNNDPSKKITSRLRPEVIFHRVLLRGESAFFLRFPSSFTI